MDFLKKNKEGWFTTRELAEHVGINSSSCIHSCKKLYRRKLIMRRKFIVPLPTCCARKRKVFKWKIVLKDGEKK